MAITQDVFRIVYEYKVFFEKKTQADGAMTRLNDNS